MRNKTRRYYSNRFRRPRLERTRGELTSKKETAQKIFWWLYFLGAVVALAGTLLREAIDSKPKGTRVPLTLRERLAVQGAAWTEHFPVAPKVLPVAR